VKETSARKVEVKAVAVRLEFAALEAALDHAIEHAELGVGEATTDVVLDVPPLEQVFRVEDAQYCGGCSIL
jgi:hypothetical protein